MTAGAGPIDPAGSPRWAIAGRVVTMDPKSTVVADGVVWVKDAAIAAITSRGDATPPGFDGVVPVETRGTIYPGLIELHNHTAYNALPLWQVPQKYTNRNTWGNTADYHRLVTAPMKTLGEATDLLPALVRYVEAKALLGGVTTTQGIALFSAAGIRRYYRGIVRNVEQTHDPLFPQAGARIADVDARDSQAFLTAIAKKTCYLLHLSEGTDEPAHQHFEALHISGDQWAITPSLAGIHCVALQPADFAVLASHSASMVWSPFSNLLLYGHTADVAAAKAAGTKSTPLRIGLGSDWSPTGSKSLFGELKVARVYSQSNGNIFTDEELLQLATNAGAEILGWQNVVGSLEVGKRADLVVVAGQADDAYAQFFAGDERRIQLVAINGTPRYGTPALMVTDGPDLEIITVGDEQRVLYLKQETEDPEVAALSLAQARSTLTDALQNIVELRSAQETFRAQEGLAEAPQPRLALDEFELTDFTDRPHLPFDGIATGPIDRALVAAPPLSSILSPITLDAVTVADDPGFLDRVALQGNLPAGLASALHALYQA